MLDGITKKHYIRVFEKFGAFAKHDSKEVESNWYLTHEIVTEELSTKVLWIGI